MSGMVAVLNYQLCQNGNLKMELNEVQLKRHGGIDPAALAAASLASAVATLAQSGLYTPVTTVLGVTILLLVLAYDVDPNRTKFQSVAYSCVAGLTTLLAAGFPLEWIFARELPQWAHCLAWVVFSTIYFFIDKPARKSQLDQPECAVK
ncbi:MAG: hypothetical protein PGN26_02825 [Xylophilus ampelinus]